MEQFLGIVEDNRLRILDPAEHCCTVRLTRLIKPKIQEAEAIEKHMVDLSDYEGNAVMVSGTLDKEELWMYEANVIDNSGPILTAVVQQMFG